MKKVSLLALSVGLLAVSGAAIAHPEGDCGRGKGKGMGRGGHSFEQLDKDKNGKVTLDELSRSKEEWLTRFDANKDGLVTEPELEAQRAAKQAERRDRIFAKRDTNNDGKLSGAEAKGPPHFFDRADANKDGSVTKEELSAALGAMSKGRTPQEHAFGKLDTNADRQLSREEARAGAARMLQRLDTNGDKALTREELARRGRGHGPRHGDGKQGPRGEGGRGTRGQNGMVKS
jgi:Ca2+-binding EF-hand superfamily protein